MIYTGIIAYHMLTGAFVLVTHLSVPLFFPCIFLSKRAVDGFESSLRYTLSDIESATHSVIQIANIARYVLPITGATIGASIGFAIGKHFEPSQSVEEQTDND
ncbi:hypothetical protein NEPTK9_001772 [Candidatus Neptunochlamydia vexilliferae]|uniref:Uncharacterized protein n=1 Tax=Candidatus Neptunichlamydia vexilliferae TaxID=1651774 RepID=A0ABS0B1I0_9BACT|nr:hypothetical protein [Candidatus Neptunochlamydia vexilliferae]